MVDAVRSLPRVALGADVVSIESAPLNSSLFLVAARADGQRLRLDANGAPRPLAQSDLDFIAGALDPQVGGYVIERIVQEDAYYFGHHRDRAVLPAYRATSNNTNAARFYLDPVTARIWAKFDRDGQLYRWLHQALHRLDFNPTVRSHPLWDLMTLALLSGVTAVLRSRHLPWHTKADGYRRGLLMGSAALAGGTLPGAAHGNRPQRGRYLSAGSSFPPNRERSLLAGSATHDTLAALFLRGSTRRSCGSWRVRAKSVTGNLQRPLRDLRVDPAILCSPARLQHCSIADTVPLPGRNQENFPGYFGNSSNCPPERAPSFSLTLRDCNNASEACAHARTAIEAIRKGDVMYRSKSSNKTTGWRIRQVLLGAAGAAALVSSLSSFAGSEEIVTSARNADLWPAPGRDLSLTRHSSLKDINTDNISKLQMVWSQSTGALRGHEGQPIVVSVDGKPMMYFVSAWPNIVQALDLSDPDNPKQIWNYVKKSDRDDSAVPRACCDVVNRGLNYTDGKIIFHTLDGFVVALDAKSGKEIWSVKHAYPEHGETITGTHADCRRQGDCGFRR